MIPPHLKAAGAAAVLAACALGAFDVAATRAEVQGVYRLSRPMFDQKDQGIALQAEAFRHPDLLPVYASSELTEHQALAFEARRVFETYPTGFDVFPVGRPKTTSLVILERLAALGPALRGRRVVVSVGPDWFLSPRGPAVGYRVNFSPLQAGEVLFGSPLSLDLKKAIARRMLAYPETLERDPLVSFAARALASDSLRGDVLYLGAKPLGWLHNAVLRLQDHFETVLEIRKSRALRPLPARQPATLDWDALDRWAREIYSSSATPPYGFDEEIVRENAGLVRGLDAAQTRSALEGLASGAEWGDFDLLLRALQELGARPFFLVPPLHGAFMEANGVPKRTREAFYARMEAALGRFSFPGRVFSDHDEDRLFCVDPVSHLAPPGWVAYDRALDDIFHDRLAPS